MENMTIEIRKIGIIGAGQMGNGIAQVCAQTGFDVVMNDISEDSLRAGLATINGNLARAIAKNQMTEAERKAALDRIKISLDYEDFADCDLVIEAASENEDVKRKIFNKLCPLLKPEAYLASNTSSISITRLGSATDRAGAVHRHSFHESGPADAARRADPRHRHRRPHVRSGQGFHHQARQDGDRGRGFSGLHRQPHPAADDQRGYLRAL